jgi:GMP synthase-like glutamine amidotransferase
MRIHYLQHETFEDPGTILEWAQARGHTINGTLIFKGEPLPAVGSFDMLVIMGGSMSAYEEEKYPWIAAEKQLIWQAVDKRKAVLGICLGAQLIAGALGAKVYKHSCKEIGWFPVHLTKQGFDSEFMRGLPLSFEALHWHGDTFDIPAGATRLATSKACFNQAFEYGTTVLGLQFHIEYTAENRGKMLENCSGDLAEPGLYVQSPDFILGQNGLFPQLRELNFRLLDNIEKRYSLLKS